MISKKDIVKILFTVFTLVGITAGVVLTQERQNIQKKAEMLCDLKNNTLCGQAAGCPKGYMCSSGRCISHTACNYPYCPATDCNLPVIPQEAVHCIMSTSGRPTTCCPIDKPLYQDGKCIALSCAKEGEICLSKVCCEGLECKYSENHGPDPVCLKKTSTPPPGGGGGGNQSAGCSSASATKCQGKNPGDSCGSGKKCIALSQKGNDGKPKCSCSTSGGGGGGTSCEKNSNPTILDIQKDGQVELFFTTFLTSTPPKIALKKNSQTCSLTDYDKLIDTQNTTSDQPINTGIQVKSGDKLCIYGEDVGNDAGPYPFEGWIEPKDNKCKDKDISSLIQSAQEQNRTIVSQECWGDYARKADCDFNDYALIVTVPQESTSNGQIKLLFRQQGITSAISSNLNEQLATRITFIGNGKSYIIEKAIPAVDNTGMWIAQISTDDQNNSIPPGSYTLLIKGASHLQKKFTDITINNDPTLIDKGEEVKDELKAGDVNGDNAITIEDISTVLKYYTDFKKKVNQDDVKMVLSDINKDGFITIDDVALVALNWSDFAIKGDE